MFKCCGQEVNAEQSVVGREAFDPDLDKYSRFEKVEGSANTVANTLGLT